MKLHQHEQRILRFILEKGNTTHAELKAHFLPLSPIIVDIYLVQLREKHLVGEVIRGKIRPTELARKIQEILPKIPVRELIIPGR